MNDYRLQTEISDEVKREMALHAEKSVLTAKIQSQKDQIAERSYTFSKVLSLLVFLNLLFSLVFQRPADFFVVIVYGAAYLAEIVWLTFGWRKRLRELEEWQIIADEAENQKYINQ